MYNFLLRGEPNDLTLFQYEQHPLERMRRVPLLGDELFNQALVTCAPSDGQSPSDLLFDSGHFVVERAT